MNKILHIIHVDDDQHSLDSFRELVISRPSLHYLQGFLKAEDAAAFMLDNEVDIAVLDVEMQGLNGLWLAEQIEETGVHIVFLSAHSGYAVKAFHAYALDFLEKPVTAHKLDECIQHYHRWQAKMNRSQLMQVQEVFHTHVDHLQLPKQIFLKTEGTVKIILLEDITYFGAAGKQTQIFTKDGTMECSPNMLKLYEDFLQGHPDFVRIHRTSIVNRNYVSHFKKDGAKQKATVVLQDGTELEVSYQRRDELLEKLAL